MNAIADTIFWTWIVLTLIQSNLTWKYVSALCSSWKRAESSEVATFKAAIILCLRGGDPFLKDCIRALLNQNYPNYEIHIVVDSEQDPAWTIVQQTLGEVKATVPVYVRPLELKRSTCSLKCSALLQATAGLGEDVEAIALIDADTIAHPTWLQELMKPLMDPHVGLATGIRWYAPVGTQWGTLNRYLWNAFSVMSMYFNQVPWGGTLGFRRKLLLQADAVKLWGNALCEDVPLRHAAFDRGLTCECMPSLLSVNQEECTLQSFLRWAGRQLLLTRLYHPNWSQMAFDILFAPGMTIIGCAVLLGALLTGQWDTASHLAIGFTVFWIGACILPLVAFDYSMRRVAATWGKSIPPMSIGIMLKLPVLILFGYFTAIASVLPVFMARRMEWRGIIYEIQDAQRVRLLEYRPYQSCSQTLNPNASL